jgi:cation-transporting ATPase 13A3/4/5
MTIISQILSPLLPAVLIISQNVTNGRLRENGISCTDPNRITLAGKAKFICFDKTGTLTKEGLELFGVEEYQDNCFKHVEPVFENLSENARRILLSCHSLSLVRFLMSSIVG